MPAPSALCMGLLAASGIASALPNMANMQAPAPVTVTVTVSPSGCNGPAASAPAKVIKVDDKAGNNNTTVKVGKAIYLITNGERNSVVALRILPDGTLSGGSSTPTGQKGGTGTDGSTKKPAAKDGLFSQSALTLAGNTLFTVNAGSNTVSMFNIDPNDVGRLTQVGRPVPVPGDFPNTIAASNKGQLVCVGMTGAKAGISCANFGRKGLGRMDNLRKFDLNQTNPPVGPTNTVSQLFFSLDEKHLFATVKGDPEKKNFGFLDAFEVQDRAVRRNYMYPGASKAQDADADKAKEEADKKAKEEQDKKNKEEQDKKNKEDADKKAKEEQDKKNKEEQDKKKKEEDDKKKKEEEDKKKKKGPAANKPAQGKKLSTTEIKSVINGTAVLFGSAQIPGSTDIFATDASFGAAILSVANDGRASLKASGKIDNQKATCWVTISDATKTAFVTDVAAARIVEMSTADAKVLGEINVADTKASGLIDLKAAGGFLYALAPGDGKIPSQVIVVDVKGGAKQAKIVQKVDLGIFGGVNTIQGMAILE